MMKTTDDVKVAFEDDVGVKVTFEDDVEVSFLIEMAGMKLSLSFQDFCKLQNVLNYINPMLILDEDGNIRPYASKRYDYLR